MALGESAARILLVDANPLDVKADVELSTIPVLVVPTSADDSEVAWAYKQGVKAFITKPTTLERWIAAISTIEAFWFELARVPSR